MLWPRWWTLGDEIVTHHLTYIEKGTKALVSAPRKRMTPIRPSTGSAVRLFPHTTTLGIAEGIETALSAFQLFNVPTWAALDANNLSSFEIPKDVKRLMIFADNDDSYTGRKAAFTLAWQANRKGLKATVHIPPTTNNDWNDEIGKTNA